MNLTIYNEIKKRILFVEYSPGEMLSEKQLATEFGVSRTPVREVFLRLEWEKLVVIMPRAGIMVSKLEFQQLRDVYQTRVSVEGFVARLATALCNESHIKELKDLLVRCRNIRQSKDRSELVSVDLEGREILFRAANNEPLKEVSDYLYFQTQRVWYLIFERADFDKIVEEQIDEIIKTMELMEEGDPLKAEIFRQKLIINYMERVKDVFNYPSSTASFGYNGADLSY